MTQTMKAVLISGATSGIGLAAAIAMHRRGWYIYAAGLPQDPTQALYAAIPERMSYLPLDIRDEQAVAEAAQQIAADRGEAGLDGLVNNAGINRPGPLEALPVAQLREQFDVNIFGHLQMIQAMLPLLRQGETGRIVNVSSIMGRVAMPLLGAYSMSKHAMEAMSDVLRLELAPWGIAVISIQPGAIDTPMTHAMPQMLDQQAQQLNSVMQAHYGVLFTQMQQALASQARSAIAPEKVADAIAQGLSSAKPATRYAVGGAASGLMMMRRFAPDAIGDSILRRALGLSGG